jgi:hypothetical protein
MLSDSLPNAAGSLFVRLDFDRFVGGIKREFRFDILRAIKPIFANGYKNLSTIFMNYSFIVGTLLFTLLRILVCIDLKYFLP